ncbi:MAG TPA: GxxExxY protein [Candidatus Binatia bacterium]|jgi:GxxExxY protein|nr:GxxExxY protein [Candidatus Binatia bacterium]
MAVTCPIRFHQFTEREFHDKDYAVMTHAFACHNEIGRFCDEAIYQADLAARLSAAGLKPVRREVPVVVSWKDFRKRYFLDLVVEDAVVYDLKAATTLIGDHDAQMLNYLLLLGSFEIELTTLFRK